MELLVTSTVYTEIYLLSLLLFTVEGMDYGALDINLMFEKCMMRKCVDITIIDNEMNEANETFTFNLSRTTDLSPRIILDPVNGESYLIDDDDGELVIIEHQ